MPARAILFILGVLTSCGAGRPVRSERPSGPRPSSAPERPIPAVVERPAEWAQSPSLPHRTLGNAEAERGAHKPPSKADRIRSRLQVEALERIRHLFPDSAVADGNVGATWVYHSVRTVASSGEPPPGLEAIRVQRQPRGGGSIVSETLVLAPSGEVLLRAQALTPSPPHSILVGGFTIDLREPDQVRRLASLPVAPIRLGSVVRMGRAQLEENLESVQRQGWTAWDLPHEEPGLFVIEGPSSDEPSPPWPFESASLGTLRINDLEWKSGPRGLEWRARMLVNFYGSGKTSPGRREFFLAGTL